MYRGIFVSLPGWRRAALLLPALLFLFCLFSLPSCNGTGEVEEDRIYGDSDKAYYSGQFDGGGISASEILGFSNSGNLAEIESRLSDGPNHGTTMISFVSSEIGLPAGGYVTLAITGDGIAFTDDSSDSGDGKVWFTIPRFLDGTTITVSVIVRKADGTVVRSGSKTQTVQGDSSDIYVSLSGEDSDEWTLPSAITVSASPTSITYDASSPQNLSFSVVGLTPPPSGSLSYSWEQTGGIAFTETGDSLTANLSQFIGASPAAGAHIASATVTVTYTDADGNVSTATGTGVVNVTVISLPSFTIKITPPAGVETHAGSAGAFDLADLTKQFTFEAEGDFPEGTSFVWSQGGTGISLPGTRSFSASPADWGFTSWDGVAGGTAGYTINCRAVNPKAVNSPKSAAAKNFTLYQPTLPKPVIDVPTTSNGTYIGVEGSTYSFYAVSSGSAYDTKLSFATSTTMPAGTTFNWKVDGTSKTGDSYGASWANQSLGSIWTADMPASFTVTCTAVNPGYVSVESDPITVKVLQYPSSVPVFHTYIDSYPGQQYSDGTHCYDVVGNSIIGVKLYENGVSTGTLPPNGTASFMWKVNGVAVKTTATQEAGLTVSAVLSALGKSISDLPNYDSTMLAPPSGGLAVEIHCTITVTVSGVTKSSDTSSAHETVRKLFLYQ